MSRRLMSAWIAVMALAVCPWPHPRAAASGPVAIDRSASTMVLSGDWSYHAAELVPADAFQPGFDDRAWPHMRVPSNWFLQGLDRSGAVWFRRTFETPAGAGARTRLWFGGVDYAADVWINGHYLGFHEGYFEEFAFDVAPWLRPRGRQNVLAVRVDSPLEQGESWSLHKRLIKGVFGHHDARPGNAWSDRGQDQNTGGIWGAVRLELAGDASVDAIRVRPDAVTSSGTTLHDGQTARLTASIDLTNASASPRRLRVRVSASPINFVPARPSAAELITERIVPHGTLRVPVVLDVPHAEMWWTWDHGHPSLYRLDVQLLDGDVVLNSGSRVFGFRSITFDQGTGAWRLNGRRLFLRGTNYIASQWLSEMTPDKYRLDLALMRQSGVNAIRVHAHVEGEEFYRQADENGLLVWQDFPLQWGYADDPAFVDEAARQAAAMIDQLDHHPSIAAWSAHNEPPWDAAWMKQKYPDYRADQNRALDVRLAAVMRAHDASRHVHLASTTGEHPWLGWYSGVWSDYARPTKQTLITEFGAQALPGLDTLRRFIPEADLWPATDAGWASWTYHDFQPRETFTLAHVPRGASTQELIANTQEYQARLVQFAAESYRRQKYSPVGGIFQFMFNECWPSANWGVVDYWRHPKPGFDALSVAYQPVLPSIEWTPRQLTPAAPVTASIWVVNDLWEAFPNASLEWTLRSTAGVMETSRRMFPIMPDTAANVVPFERLLPAGRYTLLVVLRDQKGRPLGRNAWTFVVEEP